MPLAGDAFIILWHDIAPEGEQEYHRWHTRQHMPERLSHPGFLRSRRGVDWQAGYQRYLTIYEGEGLEVFTSEDYQRSLNNPTVWTTRMAPEFRNFLRMACAVGATSGDGIGGALATFRAGLPAHLDEAQALEALRATVAAFGEMDCVTAVHIAFARPAYSDQRTTEVELRPEMREQPFDVVVVVEGVGLTELRQVADNMAVALGEAGLQDVVGQCYDMAYLLQRDRSGSR